MTRSKVASEVEDDMFDNWDEGGFGDYDDGDFGEEEGDESQVKKDIIAITINAIDIAINAIASIVIAITITLNVIGISGGKGERQGAGESAQQGVAKSRRKFQI